MITIVLLLLLVVLLLFSAIVTNMNLTSNMRRDIFVVLGAPAVDPRRTSSMLWTPFPGGVGACYGHAIKTPRTPAMTNM